MNLKTKANGGGFTIIELLVVIAIISIVAGIVLVNVTKYINNAKFAAIKQELNLASYSAANYLAINGNYNGVCSSSELNNISHYMDELCSGVFCGHACSDGTNLPVCGNNKWAWWVWTSDLYYCVDSTGTKMYNAGPLFCVCTPLP